MNKIITVLALVLGIIFGNSDIKHYAIDREIKSYTKTHKEEIGNRIKERFGTDFRLPEIVFGFNERYKYRGAGFLERDIVSVNPSFFVSPQENFLEEFSRKFRGEDSPSIEHVLAHEFGHSWALTLCEKWIENCYQRVSDGDDADFAYVHEGLAEYAAQEVVTNPENPVEEYFLIASIAEKYGEKGIRCMFQNPPNESNRKQPKIYEVKVGKCVMTKPPNHRLQ